MDETYLHVSALLVDNIGTITVHSIREPFLDDEHYCFYGVIQIDGVEVDLDVYKVSKYRVATFGTKGLSR